VLNFDSLVEACLQVYNLSAPGILRGQTRGKEDFFMREYEVVLIALPDIDETNLNTMVDKVKAWITTAGGTVSKVDKWGKRRLTYTIRKQREGQYVLIKAEMDPKFTSELERNLRFLEPIMRFMISSVEQL
jgi:small subunit ribosomal protein S6